MFVNFNILNQLGSPAINSNTFANRPAAGQTGRLFVSTDTFEIYRDNGTTWDLIGGPGSSTITGTGTATQVAYFTSSQAIGSSANLYWDNTAGALGINTALPGAELDVHGTGVMVQLNATTATANSLLAFQRSGNGLWRIGDIYNGGANFFELHNTVLTNNAIQVLASSNEATFLSGKTYSTGNAIGIAVQHNLTIPNGVNVGVAALGGVNSNLNLTLQGSTTVAATGRQGLEGSNSINFTGAGTLTMTQGSTVRAFSALSSVYAFNGSAVGTITHLAGLRICFPDNVGSAVNITNNYALLINDQTTGTGTVTYTNRWGIYQEGASDLNYFAANTLIGSTVNSGEKLQVNGKSYFSDNISLAVTLSPWINTFKVLQIGSITALWDLTTITGLSSNLYNDGANKRITAGFSTRYLQNSGEHIWNVAPTGLANSVVSFAQPMVLDNSGNLVIGATAAAVKLHAVSSGADIMKLETTGFGTGGVYFQLKNTSGDLCYIGYGSSGNNNFSLFNYKNADLVFATNNAEGMRLSSSLNLLIGTTTDAGQKLQVNGTVATTSSITTGAPTGGTAAAWKFGTRVAATVVVNTTEYIELDVGGTLYKLATVT